MKASPKILISILTVFLFVTSAISIVTAQGTTLKSSPVVETPAQYNGYVPTNNGDVLLDPPLVKIIPTDHTYGMTDGWLHGYVLPGYVSKTGAMLLFFDPNHNNKDLCFDYVLVNIIDRGTGAKRVNFNTNGEASIDIASLVDTTYKPVSGEQNVTFIGLRENRIGPDRSKWDWIMFWVDTTAPTIIDDPLISPRVFSHNTGFIKKTFILDKVIVIVNDFPQEANNYLNGAGIEQSGIKHFVITFGGTVVFDQEYPGQRVGHSEQMAVLTVFTAEQTTAYLASGITVKVEDWAGHISEKTFNPKSDSVNNVVKYPSDSVNKVVKQPINRPLIGQFQNLLSRSPVLARLVNTIVKP